MSRAPRRTAPALVVAAFVLLLALAPGAGAYRVTTLTGPVGPMTPAISPDGRTAYVTSNAGNAIGVIDLEAGAIVASIPLPATPFGIAITPDGARAWVTASDSRLYPIDLATRTVLGSGVRTTATGDAAPQGVAITADGRTAYVANPGSGVPGSTSSGMAAIDLAAGQLIRNESSSMRPTAVAVHGSRTEVLATDEIGDLVAIVDLDDTPQTALIFDTRLRSPRAAVISPDGTRAYVANRRAENVVAVINMAQASVATTFVGTAGSGPTGVALDPTGRRLYVTLTLAGKVAVYDTVSGELLETIDLDGASPEFAAIAADGSRLVTANWSTNSVSIIQLAPFAPTALAATASDTTATVSFTAPAANGTAITGYEYSLNGGAWTAASPAVTASPLAIGGLTPGTAYAIRVRAVDARGPGVTSAAVSVTTQSPAAAPRATAFRARTPSTTRTRAGETQLRTTVTTPGAGTITQRATTSGPGRAKAVTRCRTSVRVKAAGDHVVTCTLNAKAQTALKRGRLVLRVATTFTAKGAKTGETTTAHVVVPRRR